MRPSLPSSGLLTCVDADADRAANPTAPPPPPQARQHVGTSPSSLHADHPAPPSVPLISSHEPSLTRGRAPTVSGGRGPSSRSQTPPWPVVAISRQSPDAGLERKTSHPYGHHRNTSIVHGIQHSRNTSFVNSPATSPLSPQMIAAAAGAAPHALDGPKSLQDELTELPSVNGTPGTMNGGGRYGNGVLSANGDPSASDGASSMSQRRPERMHSGRVKREKHGLGHHEERRHVRSQSKHHDKMQDEQDLQTVGDMALHHLFNSFVGQADQKINQCVAEGQGPEPQVEHICGPGVDPAFDQLISALGYIVRHKPKPLIDVLMFWRKAKSNEANVKRDELSQVRSAENEHAPTNATLALQQRVLIAERKSTIAIYLLCRVLMEIIGQTDLNCLKIDMADRLEDIVYSQLKTADPESLEDSPLKHANWTVFAQLLGVMSEINFNGVSDRFIADLEKMQKHLGVKGLVTREIEGRAVLIVKGMIYLRVKFYPDDAWSRTCTLMLALAKLFAGVHGQPVKYAYCHLFKELLLPLAAKATSELNMPKWKLVVDTIKPRLTQMLSKPKHWQMAFPLMTVLTCASPTEIFAAQWQILIIPLAPRLKERATRPSALKNIGRLVWTYLYRIAEPYGVTIRKLDEIIRLVFQPGKRSYLSTETAIAEPLIQLIRFIGFKYQDLCFKNIIFPLMNSEQFGAGKELKVDNLEPERMVIGIRAFLAVMADLEKGEQPPFPVTFETDDVFRPFELSTLPGSPRSLGQAQTPSKATTVKEERLSRPVMIADFPEIAKESYNKFCKILGEITIICDNAFGGQAVLDEKFSSQTPKTPMAEAFSFGRRDDHSASPDPRQGFYDLLHVAVQALPRCLSPHINFNSLINLLCTGTAHVQHGIAASSAQSLKSIARQSHAQQVTIGFARFIFNFEDRYATMSDGGMLGPGHIESTLRLYVELLQIWIDEIKKRTKKASAEPSEGDTADTRGAQLDLAGMGAYVDEIESHGLFFLCSPSRRVRAFAVTVLRLVTEFDTALGKEGSRVIRILEGSPQVVMDVNDEKLSLAERSRLQRGMRKSNIRSTLVDLCGSDAPYDSALWFKMFPNLIRISFEVCPFAVAHTRNNVCGRLLQMQRTISSVADGQRQSPYPASEMAANKASGRMASTAPELAIEQWKLYLIFACTTLTNARTSHALQVSQHTRKASKSSQKSTQFNRVYSAEDLFKRVIPFLAVENPAVREAAVIGLGSINMNIYRTLLESLQDVVARCSEEAKTRLIAMHQRTASSPRRNRRTDHLRTEITHVYKLTSHFLKSAEVYGDEWILNNLVNYTKDLRLFLNDAEVQNEWHFCKLRTHYCGLVEELFEGINRTKDPIRWMPFQARKAAFALMEDWCGYSPNQSQIRQREDSMRRSILDREHDPGHKGFATAAMEIEKKELRTGALSSMAALCGGPIRITTDSGVILQFDVRRMISWINTIFETPSDRTHAIGRRALRNMILHNMEHPYLLEKSIEMCYLARSPKSLESYFETVTEVLTEREDFPLPFHKVLGVGLYTLGNQNNQIRMKSARILRKLEERQQKSSKLQELDISISDKTIAVYKTAQFEMSRRMANQHSELAFYVLSEFSLYFKDLAPDQQRNMVAAMLPWIQTMELQLDPNGGPTGSSYMLLVNLFEITVRCGNLLHNEIQALWQALATGPHAGNVQLVLDFIISLCSDKREQNFVDYAKQIVVYLSNTPAGSKVVEYLMLKITPRAMAPEQRDAPQIPSDVAAFPYVADMGLVLPSSSKQSGFSLGQLCLILLVDLMVSPIQLARESVPLLLQAVLVLWDHYTPVVQDQAREMLVHLIHELVISRIDVGETVPDKAYIEDFIESIRQHSPKVVWTYGDANGKPEEDAGNRVPETMTYVADEVVKVFSITYPGIREELAKTTLSWATSCPVRHIACRSFQLFRCTLSALDANMLGDMLARLSNTISDDESDIQTFSMEILTTLKTVIEALSRADLLGYPQLFWTTCACLNTIHEPEFMESLAMLDKLLQKLDLADPAVVRLLNQHRPTRWEGSFEGLADLVYRGVRSSICLDRSLHILEKLAALPPSELVGPESVLLFTILANFPRFLRIFDSESRDRNVLESAENLVNIAACKGMTNISEALDGLVQGRYRSDKDFVTQMVATMRTALFPQHDFQTLVFLMGLLLNKISWVKNKTMQLLCVIITEIDMRKPAITSKGTDLISPLLRLLQTEFCPQALQVLDNVLTTPSFVEQSPLDKQHLRMSMAGSHSSRAFRKEYERTQSLYGIPEETGWSIPMPAVHSIMTRNNVHAVFYSSIAQEMSGEPEVSTPKVEFKAEELPPNYGSYFPPDGRTATMTSQEVHGDGHMAELVMTLDSLDDWFDDDATTSGHGQARPDVSRVQTAPTDVRENLYDQQTAPILHKSLNRNASVTSFQTGFADMKSTPTRDPGVMTPTAFTAPRDALPHSLPLPRPGMHARSVTSPAVSNQRTPLSAGPGGPGPIIDDIEESFSDDDFSLRRDPSNEKPLSLENVMVRPYAQTRTALRFGMRRLTGGEKERERSRDAIRAMQIQQGNPQVPKVPEVYLQDSRSAEP